MLELDSPRWSELSHAYGIASQLSSVPSTWQKDFGFSDYSDFPDTPTALRLLEGSLQSATNPDSTEAELWDLLWSMLCHQGDAYTASYAAVPHIVRIAFTVKDLPNWQFFGLPACIEIARATGNGPAIPEDLAHPYFASLSRIHDLIHNIACHEWDELLCRIVAGTLAVLKGHPVLGGTIMDLSPDVISDFPLQQ